MKVLVQNSKSRALLYFGPFNMFKNKFYIVVLTVVSGILFFPTVKCIPNHCSFLLTSLTVEARNKRESTAFSKEYNFVERERGK